MMMRTMRRMLKMMLIISSIEIVTFLHSISIDDDDLVVDTSEEDDASSGSDFMLQEEKKAATGVCIVLLNRNFVFPKIRFTFHFYRPLSFLRHH